MPEDGNDSSCCTPIVELDVSAVAAGDLAARFKALGDPTRLRLLGLIASNIEMCVCDLTEPLGLTQPTVSHHLKILASAGLVRREKRGRWAYFTVDNDELADLARALLPEGPFARQDAGLPIA
ncbi:MAG: helix-turn-helix transcriptional regulator [bacterium]|nr:helix-turn-helix transcriptional regulator [bacterium]MCP5032465.1 helix-turn-helix transcriptional regulator [Actinomycetes bacterium]